MRILGIDPGSQCTGYGCIDRFGHAMELIGHGTLFADKKKDFFERLYKMAEDLSVILLKYAPQVIAIERVFFAKNAASALVLGQMRGAFIFIAKKHACEVVEYSATEVKSAIVGYGHAEKKQVQKILIQQLKIIDSFSSLDASDGLALAVCHGFYQQKGGKR